MDHIDNGILNNFRTPQQRDKYFKIRNTLNLIFIIMVIVTITLYFIYPLPDGLPAFFSSCLIAILVKAVEVYLRISIKQNKNDKR